MLDPLLSQIGVNIASQVIYDVLKGVFTEDPNPSTETVKTALASHLSIENIDAKTEGIIEMLARNGDIGISGSKLYAKRTAVMESALGTSFTFGNNSTISGGGSAIVAGQGASLVGQGGARVELDDGGIRFYT